MLAEDDDDMTAFLKNHLYDIQNTGPNKQPWRFHGAWHIHGKCIENYIGIARFLAKLNIFYMQTTTNAATTYSPMCLATTVASTTPTRRRPPVPSRRR